MGLRILLISHNPMNLSENNGRTLRNLLSDVDAESVSHLFFHDGEIDAPFCNSFYEITDFDISHSLAYFKKAGNVVNPSNEKRHDDTSKYIKHCDKKPFTRFLRDVAWGFNTWKSKKLKEWLTEQKPNVIFFYGSDSVFCHKIAHWVKKYLKIPMLIYWVDDFYLSLSNGQKGLFSFINKTRFKRIAKKNILDSKNICITPKMADAYKKVFKKEFDVLFNSSFLTSFASKEVSNPIKMSYLGNIGLGRCESLLKIGSIINEFNLPIQLSVYSGEQRQCLLDKIKSGNGLQFLGKVSYEKVLNIMETSDILVHVEDFSEKNINACRYSLSTKIADCLASNRCLFCYGPSEVASIDYLKNNNGALVATNEDELKEILSSIVKDKELIKNTAKAGVSLFEKNHISKNNNFYIFY